MAAVREAREEVGIEILPDHLELVHVSYRPKHDATGDRVDFFFRTSQWSGEVKNNEPEKCDDLQWVPLDQLPKNMTPHVRDALECIIKGILFKELSVEWLKKEGVYLL